MSESNDTDLIKDQIAKTLARAYPPVVMSIEDVAVFCGLSYNHVRNDLQNQPDFPRKLDRFKTPRWSRDSIMAWAQVSP